MRVNKGNTVFAAGSITALGFVLADADDRQGYFWMHRGYVFPFLRDAIKSQRDDVCVPLAAVESVERMPGKTEVKLMISHAEIQELPERWQMQPQPTLDEMLRSLPMTATGAVPVLPQLPAPQPMERPASFADAQTLGETVVSQFSQKAELIREIAKIQAAMESEQIPETLKQLLTQEADAAYSRLKVITEQTDAQMGAYLSRNGR